MRIRFEHNVIPDVWVLLHRHGSYQRCRFVDDDGRVHRYQTPMPEHLIKLYCKKLNHAIFEYGNAVVHLLSDGAVEIEADTYPVLKKAAEMAGIYE